MQPKRPLTPSTMIACPTCGKEVKSRGLATHMRNEQRSGLLRGGRAGRPPKAPEESEDGAGESEDGAGGFGEESGDGVTGAGDGRSADFVPLVNSAQSDASLGQEASLLGQEAAPVGLRFPGEEAEKIPARAQDFAPAKAATGGMLRVRGAIMHRTPSLVLSNEAMALFEYAATTWPDKYGRSADLAEDLSRFLDDIVISYFRLYGMGPVMYQGVGLVGETRRQAVPTGGQNGHASSG